MVLGERVGDPDRTAGPALLAGLPRRPLRPARRSAAWPGGDEGVGDDLGQAGPDQRRPDGVAELERLGPLGRHDRVRRLAGSVS